MIKVESMDKAINQVLERYAEEVRDSMADVINNTAIDCVDELKSTSPKESGQYSKLWRKKVTENFLYKFTAVVYNYQYQLTHLLERGHLIVDKNGKIRGKGKTQEKPHIEPAEKRAISNYERDLRKVINDIK